MTDAERAYIREVAENYAKGWLADGATGNAPGLDCADYIETAILEVIEALRARKARKARTGGGGE